MSPELPKTAIFRVDEQDSDIHTSSHLVLYREDQPADLGFTPTVIFEVLGVRPPLGTKLKVTVEVLDE